MVFGSSGGIGSATVKKFRLNEHRVIEVNRSQLDLASHNRDHLMSYLLKKNDPAVVINCAGSYSNHCDIASEEMLSVNLGSNWSIVRHYAVDPRPVRIIMLGSSAYRAGKPQHMLYAATKAGLHNLWQGAIEYFRDTPVEIDIVHPSRTRTQMISKTFDPTLDYLEPETVAEAIYDLVIENQKGRCVELSFKEKS
jgi:short-subunit dehydrogenase